MRANRVVCVALLLLPVLPHPGAAAGPSFWDQRTCHTIGGTRYCVTLGAPRIEVWGEEGPVLVTHLPEAPPDFLVLPTAIGIYTRRNLGFDPDPLTAPGGWIHPQPARWVSNTLSRQVAHPALTGYRLAFGIGVGDGPSRWDAVKEGQADDVFGWRWPATTFPSDFLFVWRGESEDGSVDFDCWQNPQGGQQCLTATPEPATIVLLLTGLVGMAAITLLRRRAASVGRN